MYQAIHYTVLASIDQNYNYIKLPIPPIHSQWNDQYFNLHHSKILWSSQQHGRTSSI